MIEFLCKDTPVSPTIDPLMDPCDYVNMDLYIFFIMCFNLPVAIAMQCETLYCTEDSKCCQNTVYWEIFEVK